MAPPGIGYLPPAGGFNGQVTKPPNPPHSNIVKKYANWNVYFLCGFDIEDGHTSQTCPGHWCKMNHQEGFTRKKIKAVDQCRVRPLHKGDAQVAVPKLLVVWGGRNYSK
jgi:hypothetical protein